MTTRDDLLKLNVFSEIDPAIISLFLSHAEERIFKPGDVLRKEGALDSGLFFIVEGSALVRKTLTENTTETKTVARVGKGEFLGEMSAINKLPASATVTAETDVKALFLSRESMAQLRKTNQSGALDLVLLILAGTSHRLRETTNAYVAIYELSRVLAKTPNIEEILDSIFSLFESHLPAETTLSFYRWNPFNEEYIPLRNTGPHAALFKQTLEANTLLLKQLEPGSMSFDSLTDKSAVFPLTTTTGHLILARADAGGTREGLYLFYHPTSAVFMNADKTLIETIASLSSLALSDVRIREEEIAKQRYLRAKMGSIET